MRIAIIGGGLAGLTAAYRIHQADPAAQVDVFEADARVGGKLFTVPFEFGPVDMGGEAYIGARREIADLVSELGLDEHVVLPSDARSQLYTGGALHDLPAATMMGIPAAPEPVAHLVSADTARRIAAEGAQPLEWERGGEVSVGKLVAERLGQEVNDRLLSAFLGGVYSASAMDLGLRATIPALAAKLDEMETPTLTGAVRELLDARPSAPHGPRPPVFRALRGGFAQLYDELVEQSGAAVYVDAFISGVRRVGQRFRLAGADGEFDRVLLATPAPTTGMLLRDVAPQVGDVLRTVRLASSAVVGMRFEEDALPAHSGVLVALDEPGLHAKAFTFSSHKWPHIGARGGAFVRASFGRFGADEIVRADEDDLVDYALDDLQAITGFDGRAAGLTEIYVQRWFGGIPAYGPQHLATVEQARAVLAEVPGIEATGAWAGGVGVPAVVADASAAAQRILA